eukprot:1325598-Pyramimonas_sp.AAC.1
MPLSLFVGTPAQHFEAHLPSDRRLSELQHVVDTLARKVLCRLARTQLDCTHSSLSNERVRNHQAFCSFEVELRIRCQRRSQAFAKRPEKAQTDNG